MQSTMNYWNPLPPCPGSTTSDSDRSLLWASSSNFTLPQWPDGVQCPSPDNSSSDEPYHLADDLLDFSDFRTSAGETPSKSPTPTPSDFRPEDKSKRRREQNRNAQRAYRERKEKYIKNLLKHIEEMNKNHVRLSDSYESLRQEALRLQEQVQDLKGQLEFWSKAQVVVVKFPEEALAGGAPVNGLMAGPQNVNQSIDPLLGSDIAYPTI
ncbi:hypothetical protein BJX68DRAFT_242982 [Aspergillus pseudodeflectus]|uniref:BZIP domain-containing protein n=1 Tax=Aspergillus pseudodeflectus TaxID=176178 RepID=A0ABR4JZJ7_9EURO